MVKKTVAKECSVDLVCFFQEKRGKESISWARQLAMYLCLEFKLGSQEEVAERFGRNRTNLVYVQKIIATQLEMFDLKSRLRNEQLFKCRRLIQEHPVFEYARLSPPQLISQPVSA
ncbi:MAG: helix-turn-helix domain-containing protein [Minisyncoccia bacterium]